MADISKITLPNGSSYNFKDATARAGKQNIRNGTVSGTVDWNTLTTAGTYKIQNTIMTADNNAPVDEYAFGILIVFDSESDGETRIMQIYFPHNCMHNYMYTRMRNNGGWNKWKSLSKDADTVDGKHASDFAAASHTHTKSQISDFPTIPTKTSQLTNDSGFKTTDNNTTYSLSKSGSTITLTGSDGKTTSVTDSDTNTWRGIQNNLTSDSTTDSLSAAQGKVLKGLVDGKAASSHTHSYLPLAGGEMNGAVKWNSNSLPQQTAAVKYLVCIDAFADGGTMKWQSVENITVGNATKANGHTVNSDVPADAKFTDTVYTLPAATSSTLGGVKIGSNITNSSGTISLTKANVTAALGYTPPTTNTTYGVATSSTLGLVKSGTDITVDSNGNVSINDDSHNHIIGNVDGLQSALDGKAAASHTHDYAASSHTHTTQSSAATSDANASYLRQIATGTAAATTTNCPAGTLYGKY